MKIGLVLSISLPFIRLRKGQPQQFGLLWLGNRLDHTLYLGSQVRLMPRRLKTFSSTGERITVE